MHFSNLVQYSSENISPRVEFVTLVSIGVVVVTVLVLAKILTWMFLATVFERLLYSMFLLPQKLRSCYNPLLVLNVRLYLLQVLLFPLVSLWFGWCENVILLRPFPWQLADILANILRLFDVLSNFIFTTTERMRDNFL